MLTLFLGAEKKKVILPTCTIVFIGLMQSPERSPEVERKSHSCAYHMAGITMVSDPGKQMTGSLNACSTALVESSEPSFLHL